MKRPWVVVITTGILVLGAAIFLFIKPNSSTRRTLNNNVAPTSQFEQEKEGLTSLLEQPGNDIGIGLRAVDDQGQPVSNLVLNISVYSDGRHKSFEGLVKTNNKGEASLRLKGDELQPRESEIVVSTPSEETDYFVLWNGHVVLGEVTIPVQPGLMIVQ